MNSKKLKDKVRQLVESLQNQQVTIQLDGFTTWCLIEKLKLAKYHPKNERLATNDIDVLIAYLNSVILNAEPKYQMIIDANEVMDEAEIYDLENNHKCDRYSDMSEELKTDCLISAKAFNVATQLLAQFHGKKENWLKQITEESTRYILSLSIKNREKIIHEMDLNLLKQFPK